jgi:SLT domain-containing protein
MKGLPIGTDNGVLHIIDMESSGNPNAINLTDSNAVAGYPSQGLMQTIPQTFAAYAGEFAGRGITDPFANIYAGISYAVANYGLSWLASGGNTSAAGGYIGYDEGGWLNHASAGFNMSGKPEPVFTSAQWAILSGNLQMEQTILDSVRSLSTSSIKDTVVDVLTATLAARISTPAATTERQGDINYNITVGSVTMPNIRSGSDAKAFVSNLRDMAN